jgi:hypothetical protein
MLCYLRSYSCAYKSFEGVQGFFAWTYKDLKNIPPKITQHHIELDTSILLVHQAWY